MKNTRTKITLWMNKTTTTNLRSYMLLKIHDGKRTEMLKVAPAYSVHLLPFRSTTSKQRSYQHIKIKDQIKNHSLSIYRKLFLSHLMYRLMCAQFTFRRATHCIFWCFLIKGSAFPIAGLNRSFILTMPDSGTAHSILDRWSPDFHCIYCCGVSHNIAIAVFWLNMLFSCIYQPRNQASTGSITSTLFHSNKTA